MNRILQCKIPPLRNVRRINLIPALFFCMSSTLRSLLCVYFHALNTNKNSALVVEFIPYAFQVCIILIFSLLVNVSIYAATFDVKEDYKGKGLNLNLDLSYSKQQEFSNKQAIERVKKNYLLTLKLINLKQYEEANNKITAFLKQSPDQSLYYNIKALLQLTDNDEVGAEQSLQKAVTLNDRNTQALVGLAKLALDNKQFESAQEYASKALLVNQYDIRAYQILASVVMQKQGIDAVEILLIDALNKIKGNDSSELSLIQSLGKIYISKKQPKKLLKLAADFFDRNKESAFALSFLAEAQLLNQDKKGAEKTLRQIVKYDPKDAKHFFLLVQLLDQQKDKETEILGLLDQAAFNLDNLSLVLSYKVMVLIKLKQFNQAFAVARKVEKISPNNSIGKILYGDIYLAEKKYPEALENYQKAYAITPNIKVLDGILKILAIQNKSDVAVKLLSNELNKNSTDTKIRFRLAMIYQNEGQNDQAAKHYETLLTQQAENAIVLNNLAWIYNQKNNPKAVKLAKQAYELSPKSGAIADTYGHILLKNGKTQLSLKILKEAAKLNSELAEIQLHLAEAYIANQNKTLAKIVLQNLLKKEGVENKKAKALLTKLQ